MFTHNFQLSFSHSNSKSINKEVKMRKSIPITPTLLFRGCFFLIRKRVSYVGYSRIRGVVMARNHNISLYERETKKCVRALNNKKSLGRKSISVFQCEIKNIVMMYIHLTFHLLNIISFIRSKVEVQQ